ncbi:hypothetical protein PoB_002026800 [Plakobranchus ocellatus]|uniref:Uncharacterized protein n=1 Tax=Plakobranchus ocellatus TaxID=259542 RepID=A0AAV3ZGP1_9GAST|nr:hypothetical protein PoB_002026800 [Plakobranchus ocellatus]
MDDLAASSSSEVNCSMSATEPSKHSLQRSPVVSLWLACQAFNLLCCFTPSVTWTLGVKGREERGKAEDLGVSPLRAGAGFGGELGFGGGVGFGGGRNGTPWGEGRRLSGSCGWTNPPD